MSTLRIRPGFTANKITLTPTGPRSLKMIGIGSGSVSGGGTGSSAIATKIVIATAPANAISGSIFGTQPIIQLQDSASVLVPESGVPVVAYLKSGSGTLGGTKVVNTVSGSATFTNLSYTGSGNFVVGFSSVMSYVHQIFTDDVDTNHSSDYFEINTAGGRFSRAVEPTSGSTAWKSVYQSGTQVEHGSLHLAFGRGPDSGYQVPVYGGSLDFMDVTTEFDVLCDNTNIWSDKFYRSHVFADATWAQAAQMHCWAETTANLHLDPASGVNASGTVTTLGNGYNDFANFTWLTGDWTTSDPWGASAVVNRRFKIRTRLNDPGQGNGLMQLYINGVLEAETTNLDLVKTYTDYGINACYFENFTNTPFAMNYTRYYDNISVVGQTRSVVSSSLTVSTGSGEPQPGDAGLTILADYRAGGNRDLQAVTTTAQMYALFNDDSGNGQTNPVLSTNVDGAGTNAVRLDWIAASDTAPEQSAYVETSFTPFTGKSLYVWAKVRLGRTATGGGNGSIGVWALNEAHSNAHCKRFLILRQAGVGTNRIYNAWRPSNIKHSNDTNSWDSQTWSTDPMQSPGTTQTFTLKYTAPNRIEVWHNGTKVLDDTTCNMTTDSWGAVQWFATMLVPLYDMSEYWWDMVVARDT